MLAYAKSLLLKRVARVDDEGRMKILKNKGLLLCRLGMVVAAMASMSSAQAIVSPTDSANWLGSSLSILDGEAKITMNLSGVGSICSGSLLAGGQYVLTAAHCLSGDTGTSTASGISITFANTGLVASAAAYYVDPGWIQDHGNLGAGNDLALIKLSSRVTSIAGYALDLVNALGDAVLLAGYGRTGSGSSGYGAVSTNGTLHYGYNQYDGYIGNPALPVIYGYDFDNGTSSYNAFGSTGLRMNGSVVDAMIAPGDSGGGSLVNINGVWELAGVHSFISCGATGCTPNSSYGQYAADISVAANSAWLLSYLAVPEPGTLELLLGTLGAAGIRRIARRRKAAA